MLANGLNQLPESSSSEVAEKHMYFDEEIYMDGFQKCLEENHEDLELYTDEEAVGDCFINWSGLPCSNCRVKFDTSRKLVDHILVCKFTGDDAVGFFRYGIVSNELQQEITKSQERRAKSSFLTKAISNKRHLKLMVPMSSPLAVYMIRGVTVYLGNWPKMNDLVVRKKIFGEGARHLVSFSARALARKYQEIARKQDTEERNNNLAFLKKTLQNAELTSPDVVLHPSSRSSETTETLLEALSLPENSDTSTIIGEIKRNFKPKRRIKSKSHSPSTSSQPSTSNGVTNGRVGRSARRAINFGEPSTSTRLLPTERRLRSTFTPDYVTPLAAKRKPVPKSNT